MKSPREEIIERLKLAKVGKKNPVDPDFISPVFSDTDLPPEFLFKERLEEVNGLVYLYKEEKEIYLSLREMLAIKNSSTVYCLEPEIQKKLTEYSIPWESNPEYSEKIDVGITGCEFLIAKTGSVMVSSAQKSGRKMFVFPEIHIVIAEKSQLVKYLEDAYRKIIEKYEADLPSQITLITGPSRTADIEKTLILGAHGPKELHVLLTV